MLWARSVPLTRFSAYLTLTLQKQNRKKALAITQAVVFAEPSLLAGRQDLASLLLRNERWQDAAAIMTSEDAVRNFEDERRIIHLRTIAIGGIKDAKNAVRTGQKSVALTPWKKECWQALAFARSIVI
jgi:hypothetical protein